MVNDAGIIVWHKLSEEFPENLEDVIFAKWYEDKANGYYGDSRWIWLASGEFNNFEIWLDVDDTARNWNGIGFDKPTHWCVAPLWGKPE